MKNYFYDKLIMFFELFLLLILIAFSNIVMNNIYLSNNKLQFLRLSNMDLTERYNYQKDLLEVKNLEESDSGAEDLDAKKPIYLL